MTSATSHPVSQAQLRHRAVALAWWWADPVAGIDIAGLALREGREAWAGDTCCN